MSLSLVDFRGLDPFYSSSMAGGGGGVPLLSRLRLDNTGAWVIGVYPSLLCNWVSEHVDLYIKLKLVIFSFI